MGGRKRKKEEEMEKGAIVTSAAPSHEPTNFLFVLPPMFVLLFVRQKSFHKRCVRLNEKGGEVGRGEEVGTRQIHAGGAGGGLGVNSIQFQQTFQRILQWDLLVRQGVPHYIH